ncbi:hypothetical protein D9M71_513580 [compost metagenome]
MLDSDFLFFRQEGEDISSWAFPTYSNIVAKTKLVKPYVLLIPHEHLDSYIDVESKVAVKGFENSGEAPN